MISFQAEELAGVQSRLMDILLKSDIKFFPGFYLQRSVAKLHLMKHCVPVYPRVVKK